MKGDKLWDDSVQLLFPEPVKPEEDTERSQGRDAELVALRNEQILHRYYYYCYFDKKLWPEASKALKREFHLSEVTIYKIVQENGLLKRQIMNAKMTVKELQVKYPDAKWSSCAKCEK